MMFKMAENEKIYYLNAQLTHSIKLAEQDKKTINDLLLKLKILNSQNENYRVKEKRTLETINSFKLEIFNLSKLVEQNVGLTMPQEYDVRIKQKEINALKQELADKCQVCNDLERSNQNLNCQLIELNRENDDLKLNCVQLKQEMSMLNVKLERVKRVNEKLNDASTSLKDEHIFKCQTIDELNGKLEALGRNLINANQMNSDLMQHIEKCSKEIQLEKSRYKSIELDLEREIALREESLIELNQCNQTLKLKSQMVDDLKVEIVSLNRQRDKLETNLNESIQQHRSASQKANELLANLNETRAQAKSNPLHLTVHCNDHIFFALILAH